MFLPCPIEIHHWNILGMRLTQWMNEEYPWSGLSGRLANPPLRVPDPNDPEPEWFFCVIPEYGDRVLRVVVNTRVATWRVVSVFFDRGVKGEL